MTRISGAPAANNSKCNGVEGNITPSSSFSGATPGNSIFARARTTGRATELMNASAWGLRSTRLRATSIFLAIRANGFSLRYFLVRIAQTACSFFASQTRW